METVRDYHKRVITMMTTPNNVDSVNIIDLIKSGTTGIEIGVWKGSTTRRFLNKNPKRLVLIDPWSIDPYKRYGKQDFDNYLTRYENLVNGKTEAQFQEHYEDVYAEVVEEFGHLENVEICRSTSTQWFESWNGEQFDWVYIDGDHKYEGAMYDLQMSKQIVKKGGLIIGDDYKWKGPGGKEGVKQAVDEFVEETGFKLKKHGKHQFVMVNR